MKILVMLVLFSLFPLAESFAAAGENPFVAMPSPSSMPLPSMPKDLHAEEEVPKGYSDNKNVLDAMEVVGRDDNYVTLRYSNSGSGTKTSGTTYKVATIKNGDNIYLGGHSYKVSFLSNETGVRFLGHDGRVAWEGDLSTTPVYEFAPKATDYQYSPPMTAGVGVGQSSHGSSATAGASPVGGAAPAGGTPAPPPVTAMP